MDEKNINMKKEEQVSTIYSLNSKLELVPEKEMKIEASNEGVNIKKSHFYRNLIIWDVVLFFLMILWVGSDSGYEGGAIAMVVVFPVIEIIVSIILIILYKIFK